VMKVKTRVKTMPEVWQDILNIACVVKDNNELDCGEDKPPVEWVLKVEKTLIWPKEIDEVWDIVQWKLKVTAVWWNVKNPIMRDKMPDVLWFTWYTVIHNGGLVISQPYLSWNQVTWYTSGLLVSWDYIEMLVDTYVVVMPEKEEINVLCAWPEDRPQDEDKICDDKPVHAPDLRIKKYFLNTDGSITKETKTVKVGDSLTYKVIFGNSWTSAATITSIKDFLPKNVDYVSGTIYIVKWDRSYELSWGEVIDTNREVDGVYVDIYGGITLQPKSEWYIILTGMVTSGYQDSRTNFACIYLNDHKVACDDVVHKITNDVMCTKPDITTTSFGKEWWSTNVVCNADWWKADSIELDCGNGTTFTWSNVTALSWICTYPANSSTSVKSYSVVCKVNDATKDDCKATVSVDKSGWWGWWEDPHCKAAIIENEWDYRRKVTCETNNKEDYYIGITCFDGDEIHISKEKTSSFTYTCDYSSNGTYNIQCYVPKYKSSTTVTTSDTKPSQCSASSCVGTNCWWWGWWWGGWGGWGGSDPVIYDAAACFNINTNNVSIEKWEILPFFWNIRNMGSITKATELDGGFKSSVSDIRTNIIQKYEGSKCGDDDSIALNSMICSFEIRDWNRKIVDSWTFPCLRDTNWKWSNWVSDTWLLNAWMTYWKDKYRWDGSYKFFWSFTNNGNAITLRSNLNYLSTSEWKVDTFWEYKISLTSIEYLQCRSGKWSLVSPVIDHCENNFVLTNSYTVQKTPSGNLRASTTELDKYLYMNGNEVVKASALLNAIATSEYAPNKNVNDAMNNFITKYSKLAVKVSDGLKKVPWKSIYFVDKDIPLWCKDSVISLKTPTTIVQTTWNTTICGDVDYNMMLLTNWTIKFRDENSCNHRQTVKWILYANSWIFRESVKKNTKSRLNENKRCTEWWLTIKWVLIWQGLDGMMQNSRSNLNDWFETTDKKWIVMNWASVLIEYSPSVFTKSTMPPGAEDFTTALSIYKN